MTRAFAQVAHLVPRLPTYYFSGSTSAAISRVRRRCAELRRFSSEQLHQASEQLRRAECSPDANRSSSSRHLGQDRDSRTWPKRVRSATLVESFALMTEAVRRATGKVYYDVQLQGGLALARGVIAEMQTGEGKTLTTGLPAYALALTGRGVHIATTNAYLAQRDAVELEPALKMLGISVGLLPDEHDPVVKARAYTCDVTFGTGYEFGFDFLRDQIALRSRPSWKLGSRHLLRISGESIPEVNLLQREHAFAIIDEADSVLIDEATMPLILSSAVPDATAEQLLELAKTTADELVENEDFELNRATRSLRFTSEGWLKLHQPLHRQRVQGLRRPWSNYVEQALRAKLILRCDVDYVIVDDEVQIVDQNTGRIHPERTWRDGLHQAIEVREGVTLTPEKSSEGRVSRQRYFKLYDQLAGMTGTATGNEAEFRAFYGLGVVPIPTNKPSQRKTLPARFFRDNAARDAAIADQAKARFQTGQPVLVGTRTIHHSKCLAELLAQREVPHQLLNGVQDEDEATIIARSGDCGAVTIATNMAGRGTDIKIDARAKEAGGLHVIASEHNTSRRVDRQLAGRAARQGDPGSVQFFVSAEDEIFVSGNSDIPDQICRTCGDRAESPISFDEEVKQLQDRLELRNFHRRREMVQHDNWMEQILESLAKRD